VQIIGSFRGRGKPENSDEVIPVLNVIFQVVAYCVPAPEIAKLRDKHTLRK
jgi:hypothetical protein